MGCTPFHNFRSLAIRPVVASSVWPPLGRFWLWAVAIWLHTAHSVSMAQAPLPSGLREVDYGGLNFPIYGLACSPNQKYLMVSSYGGRFYMLDVSKTGAEGAWGQNEKKLWSKNYSGSSYRWGAKPIFSPDQELVLLKPTFDNPRNARFKPTKCKVLQCQTGKEILELGDEVLSADFVDDNTLLVAKESGLEWIDLKSSKVLKTKSIPEAECLAVSPDGKILALSYKPSKEEFAQLVSVGNRKREIKNAVRNKRLLEFIDLATLQSIATVEDEIDVVFRIRFTPDSRQVLILTRNYRGKHDAEKNDLAQESSGTTLANLNILKISVETGEIDRDFYYRAAYPHMAYAFNSDLTRFGQSSTATNRRGNMMPANGVEIYDFNANDKLLATVRTRFKLFKKYTEPYQFTFRNANSLAYISIGSRLCEWDFTALKDFEFNNTGNSEEAITDLAISQLDSLQKTPKFLEKRAKAGLQGMYVFDITVHKKGQVATVFGPKDAAVDVASHNYLLDLVTGFKFKDLDIPKDRRVKFQYTFNFDN